MHRPCRQLKIAAAVLFLCCVTGAFRCPAEEFPAFGFGDSRAPWHIEADTIRHTGNNEYSAEGGVIITRGDKRIRADVISFDGNTRNLVATGNVVMTAGQDILSGDRMEMNLEAEAGTIYSAELFLGRHHFYVSGNRIEKVGADSYKVDKFRITTCDPDDPDWYLTGRNLSFTVEGYGSMRHAAMWAKKIPVLYLPYLFFPVKIKRQSGFLIPELGYSGRNGGEYVQPFFWAINDSSDMTLYAHHIERRGLKLGAEYRRFFSEQSKIAVMADGLNDRKKNTALDDDYGYDSDGWLRPNSDRYWFRAKQEYAFPGGVDARLDIDVVSDQDYLNEFEDGYMGFDQTDRFFEKVFGRDLDDYNVTTRTNNLSLHKLWQRYSLNAALRWEDDIISRRWQDTDTTVQRLPVVLFNAARQAIPGLPLDYDLASEYTFCFRKDGVKGHRTDVYPRLYLPLYWRNIVFLEPSAGIRKTAWWMDKRSPEAPSRDKTLTRTIYDTRLDLSSELYRIFSINRETGAKIKHTVLPRIVHEYVFSPDEGESFPVFDDNLDLVEEENRVTYSIVNIFTLRTKRDGKEEAAAAPEYRYHDVGRFKLEQSYDIKEAREDNPAGWENGTSRRPFSPIMAEIDLRPAKNLRVAVDAGWDTYEDDWSVYDIEANLFDDRGDALSVAYRYDRNRAESIYANLSLVATRFLTLYAEHEHNYYDHIDIETSVGCLYTSGCWGFDVCYQVDCKPEGTDDRKISFMISLRGLSDMETAKDKFEQPWAE